MLVLILGLHHLPRRRIPCGFSRTDWRRRLIARLGDGPWKGIYSLVSIAGFILIIWGYGMARQDPVLLWLPPTWLRHVAILLNLDRPHPLRGLCRAGGISEGAAWSSDAPLGQGLGVRASARQRHARRPFSVRRISGLGDRRLCGGPPARPRDGDRARSPARLRNDAIAVVVGFVIWAALLWRVHEWVIGVSPLA